MYLTPEHIRTSYIRGSPTRRAASAPLILCTPFVSARLMNEDNP
jgi:hypothetical protein